MGEIKSKIYTRIEWDYLTQLNKVSEEDLKNGDAGHLPIECETEKCRAKVWVDNRMRRHKELGYQNTLCRVCLREGRRRLARLR